MAKEAPQSIKDLIASVMQQTGKQHMAIHQVQDQWPALVGKALAAHTKPVAIRRQVLYVHADEPGASYTLMMKKPELLRTVQTAAGGAITNIVVRAGTL